MGVLGYKINDDLETKFRKVVFAKRGMKKGALTPALEEAISDWIAKVENEDNQKVAKK